MVRIITVFVRTDMTKRRNSACYDQHDDPWDGNFPAIVPTNHMSRGLSEQQGKIYLLPVISIKDQSRNCKQWKGGCNIKSSFFDSVWHCWIWYKLWKQVCYWFGWEKRGDDCSAVFEFLRHAALIIRGIVVFFVIMT